MVAFLTQRGILTLACTVAPAATNPTADFATTLHRFFTQRSISTRPVPVEPMNEAERVRSPVLLADGARFTLLWKMPMPVPPAAVVLGLTCGYATFTFPGTVLTAAVGVLLYDLPAAHVWVLVPAVVLAAAALSGVGAVIGLLMPRPELATVAGQLGMTAVLFLDLWRADRLWPVLRAVRAAVPSTYAADALAAALTEKPDFAVVARGLGLTAVIAVLALLAADRAWRRAMRP